ncbi:MAG: SAM-dependent chlorinase/fluorinase [Anaerolineaceae bacterium]|nr:SAM-dependent chlorinase/fluorinase [Anaerolineaceae bacterium]
MKPVITLTTDFGAGDDEAGVLKGVIWKICPEANIADLSHAVTRHNILEGALLLGRTARYFPPGTVHVAVVDPGVGTARRGLACRLGAQFFVGPDNGLFSLLLEQAEQSTDPIEVVELDQPRFWLPEVTHVFHGRDVFAPVGAHLACGTPISMVGSPIADPVRIHIPEPQPVESGWQAQVLYVDSFGNLGTNLPAGHLAGRSDWRVRISGREIDGLVQAFGDRPAGELIALIDSSNYLSISVVNGDAAAWLPAQPGDKFEVVRNR